MIKTTLLTVAIGTLSITAFAHPRPPQSLPMIPARLRKPQKQTADPFSGKALRYEHYLREASIDQVREKILASQYQIARYQKQIRSLGDRSSTKPDNLLAIKTMRIQITMLKKKLAGLQAELDARRSNPSLNPHSINRASISLAPTLKVMGFLSRNGIQSAWIRDGHQTILIRNGQQFRNRTVQIHDHHLSIGHRLFSTPSTWGTFQVSGRLQSQSSSSENNAVMPAPGSTPQSLSMMQRQGQQQIDSRLNHSS